MPIRVAQRVACPAALPRSLQGLRVLAAPAKASNGLPSKTDLTPIIRLQTKYSE
jgi:hypothetical protein